MRIESQGRADLEVHLYRGIGPGADGIQTSDLAAMVGLDLLQGLVGGASRESG